MSSKPTTPSDHVTDTATTAAPEAGEADAATTTQVDSTEASSADGNTAVAGGLWPSVTVAEQVTLTGPGLFTGQMAELVIEPAEPGTGIVFRRTVDRQPVDIPANTQFIHNRPRHTVLRNGDAQVETVEHFLAALAGLGITDVVARVEKSGTGELPMVDGSAKPFVDLLEKAGLRHAEQGGPEPLVIREAVYVQGDGDPASAASLVALPGPQDHLEIFYTFEADAPVGRQTYRFLHYPSALSNPPEAGDQGCNGFLSDLAAARTFIFEKEAEGLKKQGWGGHLNYTDLVVIGDNGPIDNALRWEDEPVRHKVLDLIGDLMLVGRPVVGRIVAHKSGHALNHALARKLVESDEKFKKTTAGNNGSAPATPPPAAEARQPIRRRGSDDSPFDPLRLLSAEDAPLDVRKIQRILPHRFPMLLIDRVLELDGDRRAVGLKNVTMGDIFFLGHYPGTPIFPGVLIVEAMGQLGGILLSRKLEHTGKIAVLLSMDGVKMRSPVVPGDQLILVAESVRVKSRTGHVRCHARVGEKLAAEADIKFMLVDADS